MGLSAKSSAIARASPPTDAGVRHRVQPLQATRFLPVDATGEGTRLRARRRLESRSPSEARVRSFLRRDLRPAPTKDSLEVTFHPDYSVLDGRFAMNPWLQELPDPITKLVWDNAAIISPTTANEFGLKQGDLVKLTANGSDIEIPVFVLPGQADYSVALAFWPVRRDADQTRSRRRRHQRLPAPQIERDAHRRPAASSRRPAAAPDLVATQEHGVIPEGREIVVEMSLEEHRKKKANDPFKHVTGKTHIEIIAARTTRTRPSHRHPARRAHDRRRPQEGASRAGTATRNSCPAPAREKQKRVPARSRPARTAR